MRSLPIVLISFLYTDNLAASDILGKYTTQAPSPEQMMYELTEEATCIAAAEYLELDRSALHNHNYKLLVTDYSVPSDVEANLLNMTRQQYHHFLNRAHKRYDNKLLPSMLRSAYTHRCEFMNGFESRRQFNSEPPKI